jgi:hypothetical protein
MITTEDGTVIIKVSPQTEGLEREYVIEFETINSTNSALKALYVDGVGVEGFDADVLMYTIALPVGRKTLPVIEWEVGDEYQTVTLESSNEFNKPNYIHVVAGNKDVTRTYVILFTQTLSENTAHLSKLPSKSSLAWKSKESAAHMVLSGKSRSVK